jgi:hypothetical protein
MAHLLYSVHLRDWIVQQENALSPERMQIGDETEVLGARNRLKSVQVKIGESAIFYHMLWFGRVGTTIGSFVPSKLVFPERMRVRRIIAAGDVRLR